MDKNQAYNRNLERYRDRIVAHVKLALDDDIGSGDITTQAIIQNKSRAENAIIVSQDNGILCGLFEARTIFEAGGLIFKSQKTEGDAIKKGETLATIHGDASEILQRERTALNFMQVLSGIATSTYKLASQYPEHIASLRKTHPGLCYPEKRAVKVGKGFTHRLGLYDGFLIKNNHLTTIAKEMLINTKLTETVEIAAIREALHRATVFRINHQLQDLFIEIEVETLKQALTVAQFFKENRVPDMILLDNMKPHEVKKCVQTIKKVAGNELLIESSGGITSKNAKTYIETGVNIVSMSEITLFAKPLNISMKIVNYEKE